MIDINLLRADPEKVKNNLKIKKFDLDIELFNELIPVERIYKPKLKI